MGYLCGYKNTYGGFLRLFLDRLNQDGLCVITDVNIKNGYTKQFQGTMLRTQVDEVLNNEKTSFVVIKENNKTLADGYYGSFEKDHEVFTTVFNGHTFKEPLCYRVITRRNVVKMN